MIKTVTDASFQADVLSSDIPVLVDFWAAWCQPCLAMEPTLEEIAKEYEGKLIIAKLNVDENQKMAQQYDIMSIPNMLFFKGGQPASRIIGLTPKDKLAAAVNAVLA